MKLLVTGHNGYIGQVMVPFLQRCGHEVSGLDTYYYEGCQFNDAPPVAAIRKDIRDIQASDLEGFDGVVFLAALSNDALGDLDPQLTYQINRDATVRFAELARQAGVGRFLFSSSCSLYGAAGDAPLTETADMNPVTAYGTTKIEVEQELTKLADASFSPTYMRNATAYGLSPSIRIDLVVNNLTAYAYTSGEVLMKSDGSPWRPLVHVEDISRAFQAVLAADRELVHDQAFNVGRTAENYRVREVAEIVADVVPNCHLEFAEGASPDLRNYRVNFEKLETTLPDYQPVWTVREGVEELYAAYQQHGLTKDEFLSSKYLRIKTILGHQGDGRLNEALRWVA
ncbi:MAG: NAD(P)-dependent oxidoreductase [Planctomycetota bacterium]|nr:NAD(P)-dependent oxidoreductase [Planctomycetota bacterium]